MTTHVLSKYRFLKLNIVGSEANVSPAASCLKSNEGKILIASGLLKCKRPDENTFLIRNVVIFFPPYKDWIYKLILFSQQSFFMA